MKNPLLNPTHSSQDEWEEQTEKSGLAFISSSNLTLEKSSGKEKMQEINLIDKSESTVLPLLSPL